LGDRERRTKDKGERTKGKNKLQNANCKMKSERIMARGDRQKA
jgi:hypothetical protein